MMTVTDIIIMNDHVCRAVQASQWQDAVSSYSEAINACADAPPVFSAVLHSNRAAAYQGLQQYADAVADNLRAKALDPSYGKVCSRITCLCMVGILVFQMVSCLHNRSFCLLGCIKTPFASVQKRDLTHIQLTATRGQEQGENMESSA